MRKGRVLMDILITVLILFVCFWVCLVLQNVFDAGELTPAIFVLGAFVTSVVTQGYFMGIVSAVISVFAVNFAFTFPYFAFDFTIMENVISAVILLVVAWGTCGLTAIIKRQETVKAEGEKEKMRANLLRAISHDLRTPLTTIYGSSCALLEHYGEFSEAQSKEMLEGIQEDARWLSRMVENLLSVTRIDEKSVKVLTTDVALDELMDSVLVKFKKRYPNQEVIVDMPEDLVFIPIDAMLIEQVIVNLLENAVEHAIGMTRLELQVCILQNQAVFSVRDDGCGLEEEKLKHIFASQFYSENVPSDGSKSNAGIGLSVCATIIKAHGGRITAKNRPTGGCEFQFVLDLDEVSNE